MEKMLIESYIITCIYKIFILLFSECHILLIPRPVFGVLSASYSSQGGTSAAGKTDLAERVTQYTNSGPFTFEGL